MKFDKKTVAAILTGATLSVTAGLAEAVSISATALQTFPASSTITDAAGHTSAIGASLNNNGGVDSLGRNVASGQIMAVAANQTSVYHNTTTVKSWADLDIALGWMHGVSWVQVNIANSGTYKIKNEIIGLYNVNSTWLNQATTIHPAFTVWSLAGNTFTATGSGNNAYTEQSPLAYGYSSGGPNDSMGFNQVAAPSETNNSAFLIPGGVSGIVGYSNSGYAGWYNGNGDFVSSGSAGASNGVAASGFLYTDLTTYLEAGSYLIAAGGSCVDLQDCGPIKSVNALGNIWGQGWHELTVTSVPVPGAVWLFGSAIAGLVSFGRRKPMAAI